MATATDILTPEEAKADPRLRMLDAEAFAALLGVSVPTFYRALAKKQIPAAPITIGRRKLWREAFVRRWITDREAK